MKKQDQRLSDLRKLMQRELKIMPPADDDSLSTAQSAPGQTSMSSRSLSQLRNSSSVSVDSVSAVGIHKSTETLSISVAQSVGDMRNGSSVSVDSVSAAGVHKSVMSPASPATLSLSDQLTLNGQYTPTDYVSSRSSGGQRSAGRSHRSLAGSQGGVVMSPADCEYDFVRELNFKYLRHVVLKFMLSREAEVPTCLQMNNVTRI